MHLWHKLVALSSLALSFSDDTICFKNKRQKCIIMVMSRDMDYMYEILETCFGNFTKLNQISERKSLEDFGD